MVTKEEALKKAYETLKDIAENATSYEDEWCGAAAEEVLPAIEAALAQPAQEPWMYRIWNDKNAQWRLTDDCSWPAEPLYATPPQRPWVELEGKEIRDMWEEATKPERSTMTMVTSFSKAIEAKLKEKNT